MSRNVYLKTISVSEALYTMRSAVDRDVLLRTERVPAEECAGRVTAAPVYARYSSPTFHSAAMDGYAVRAESTFAAREGSPVRLVRGRDCTPVNTGNPLPEGMDAVVMIEHVLKEDDTSVQIERPAFPMQHVRRIGEDIVATELLIPQNHTLTAYDVGALLSAGIWEVEVRERVHIHLIPTGDEVLDFTQRPAPVPGQVIESNSQVFSSLARELGCVVTRTSPVRDQRDQLAEAVREGVALGAHIVVVGAGSSAGSKDFSRSVIDELGTVLVHGISVMPGKPSIMGTVGDRIVVGSPGYPVSAVVCFEELIRPLVGWLERRSLPVRPVVDVELSRKVPSKLGTEELVRLAIGRVGDKYVGTPLGRGAGMITTLTRAQGMARIPVDSEGVEQGTVLPAELFVPERELERTLVAVGSHDNTMDLLGNELMGASDPIRLSSTHVGSMGGLLALKSGSALVAGAHLFDPDEDDYNFPYLRRYLPDRKVTVVNLAIRHQGLIVPKGNPQGIRGVHDLVRDDVRFINRQRGAGTRILLDYHLKREGIAPQDVAGYEKEEFTHMAVAVNVLTGAASCGLGIYAAAKALDLDFVPLARERYDLIFPEGVRDHKIATLLELIREEGFKQKILGLGGYETTLTGRVMEPGMGLGE
jgi:putative molybdopterin biosynthesis protein